jgi:hypothetical protein
MSDLDEAGRAMIALAGDAHDPTDADRARVRAALAGRLGAAAGLGLGTAAVLGATATAKAAAGAGGVASAGGAGAAMAGAGVGGTLAMKLVGVAVAITTVVGVGTAVKVARRSTQAPAAAKISEVHGGRTVIAAAPPALPAPAREQATSKELPSVTPADDPAPSYEASNGEAANHAAPVHAVPSHAAREHAAPSHAALATTPTFSPAAAPTMPPPAAPTLSPEAQGRAKIEARDVTETDPHRRSVTPASANDHGCPPAFSGANPAAGRSGSAVADEARLVHDGVRARRAGLPACALSLLETHASHYPEGVLAEEREAERALALADLGRLLEARSAAAAFLRKHPASPLGMRLRHRIPGLGE